MKKTRYVFRGKYKLDVAGRHLVGDFVLRYKAHKENSFQAWSEAAGRLSGNALELACWRHHKVFVMGGGEPLALLVDTIGMHPGEQEPFAVTALEQPFDLAEITQLGASLPG